MANTYTQLYVHVIIAVRGRANLISVKWKEKLFQYITGIITNKNQKMMVINGMPDHVHMLVGLKPECNLSDLIRDVKSNSSRWINEQNFVKGKFEWQTGFGAFSLGQSQIKMAVSYILNQEQHHLNKTFKEEYTALLNAYQIEYNSEYIFEDFGAAPPELDSNEF